MGKGLGAHREALPLRFLVNYYRCGCANMLRIGDKVAINSYEGFGGPGIIVGIRPEYGSRFQIRMATQSKDFWAWDFEIDELSNHRFIDNQRAVFFVIRSLLGRNK